jgi:hypothetical protein
MNFPVKSLKSVEKQFAAYCHARACKDVWSCPIRCKCKPRRKFELDVRTAIAWEMKDVVNEIICFMEDAGGELKYTKRQFQENGKIRKNELHEREDAIEDLEGSINAIGLKREVLEFLWLILERHEDEEPRDKKLKKLIIRLGDIITPWWWKIRVAKRDTKECFRKDSDAYHKS